MYKMIGIAVVGMGLAGCANNPAPATTACLGLQTLLVTANAVLAVDNSPKVAHLKQDVALASQMVAAGCANPQALDAMLTQLQQDMQSAAPQPLSP